MLADANVGGVFEAAMEIAAREAEILAELRTALEKHDDKTALRLSRRLAGLEEIQ